MALGKILFLALSSRETSARSWSARSFLQQHLFKDQDSISTPSGYTLHSATNCQTKFGESASAGTSSKGETQDSCAIRCDEEPSCTGFMLGNSQRAGDCYLKKDITIEACETTATWAIYWDMYMKIPTAAPRSKLPFDPDEAVAIRSKAPKAETANLCVDASLAVYEHNQLYMHLCNYHPQQLFFLQKPGVPTETNQTWSGAMTWHTNLKGKGICVDESQSMVKEDEANPDKMHVSALYMHPCNGKPNQAWWIQEGTLQTHWSDGNKCLTYDPSDNMLGMHPCDLTFKDVNQQFYFE